MVTARENQLTTDEREITRLVQKARAEGQPDAFFGKRQWARYQLGLRLEVTTGGADPSDTWAVVMHNISGGGFGFWSKRSLDPKTPIFVREWTQSNSAEWLPACATHCTVGIQGYLVGARFDNPCSPKKEEDDDTEDATPIVEGGTETGVIGSARQCSLRVKCAFMCAFSAGLGATAVTISLKYFADGAWSFYGSLLALVGACATGGLLGWLTVTAEAHFLEAFREAIRGMAKGGRGLFQLKDTPTRELSAVRHALLDLGARWQRREDRERIQRQKLEELTQVKSNILSIVSHDLRTPLTSILLYTQMMTEELDDLGKEDQKHFLGIIATECNRLSRLVDDLLEVQRLETDKVRLDMQSQDLSGLIRNCARVFEALALSKSIELTVNCPESLPPAGADADKISQVVNNLLSNAIKYTPNDGKVDLSVEVRGKEILLCVADNGPGIPRDKWDQIFDRFAQLGDPNVSEIDGFGLGLFIVKRIMECHGGAAWVDSEVGKGSAFYISLPTEVTRTRANDSGEQATSAGRVLVCDPDPEIAALAAQALRWEHFDVRVCHSGSRLLSQLAHGDVDVIVADTLLPDMDGTELLDALREFRDRPFRLVIHSYADNSEAFIQRGVDVFLRRPVSGKELARAVKVAMGRQTAGGLTVLAVDSGHLDVARFEGLLADSGCVMLVSKTMAAAAERIRDYCVDVLLVPGGALSDDWGELSDSGLTALDETRVMVLCETVRKRERRLAEEFAVEVMAYRPGSEMEVVNVVQALRSKPAVELNS